MVEERDGRQEPQGLRDFHAHDERIARQRLDGNVARAQPPGEDLLGLEAGELPDGVVARDEAGEDGRGRIENAGTATAVVVTL